MSTDFATLLGAYGGIARRYECYPCRDRFDKEYALDAHIQRLHEPPFRGAVSPFALCMVAPHSAGATYLADFQGELRLMAAHFSPRRTVAQMYCRADPACAPTLMRMAGETFDVDPNGNRQIDCGMRVPTWDEWQGLSAAGFNRTRIRPPSAAVSHHPPPLARTVQDARRNGLQIVEIAWTVPIDIDVRHLHEQLECLIAARPDRILVDADRYVGSSAPRLEVVCAAIESLETAGYRYLGMGYFVLPGDELVLARQRGWLSYDTRGYVVGACDDLLGLGVSAISRLGLSCVENETGPERYRAAIDHGRLPVMRGVRWSADDVVRRSVIQSLICHLDVSFEAIDVGYLVDFKKYFARELVLLDDFSRLGAMEVDANHIAVTSRGRVLLPAMCGVFDRYR